MHTRLRRTAGAVVATLGILLAVIAASAAPASATTPATTTAPNECGAAFQGAPDAQLTISSTPTAGTPVAVGETITVALAWPTQAWTSLSKVLICVQLDGDDSPTLFSEEHPDAVNDGGQTYAFEVPAGAEQVCVAGRISGSPNTAFNTGDDTHKSNELCWPVGEDACPEDAGTQLHPEDCSEDVCPHDAGTQLHPEDCSEDVCPEDAGTQLHPEDCSEDVCPHDAGTQLHPEDCSEDVCPEDAGTQLHPEDCHDPVDACPALPGDQAMGTDCDPGVALLEDACPDVDGDQPAGTDCDPEVAGVDTDVAGADTEVVGVDTEVAGVVVTPRTSAPAPTVASGPAAAPRPPQVAGIQLPRTGSSTDGLVDLGVILLGAGAVMQVAARRRSSHLVG